MLGSLSCPVHRHGVPVWLMTYYGRVHATQREPREVYDFLREALRHASQDEPYRGPRTYHRDRLEYRSTTHGTGEYFTGDEEILDDGIRIYSATYVGGLVDRRARSSM